MVRVRAAFAGRLGQAAVKAQAKTGAERVAKLRAGLADKGVMRWELSPPPHLDDRAEIKALAEKLQRKRAKLAKQQAG